MSHPDHVWLADILAAARLVQHFIKGVYHEEFERDALRRSAVERQLEVIGEAAKQVSQVFRDAHPEIPWRKMAGMRDILIHAYRSVDPDEVWNAAKIAIPRLIADLEPLVPRVGEQREDVTS